MLRSPSGFRRFSQGVVLYNLAVILWGAYVRASGSGAGCGSHWPTCNGEVVPRSPSLKTLVEFTHRATSGLALASVILLVVWAWRAFPKGSWVRKGAGASLFFMLTEAAVGAGLVLFELVADNATMARAMFMAVHLLNTFLLVAAMTLTAWWAQGGAAPRLRGQGLVGVLLAAGLAGLMLLGVSGAITALGDTLFPASSLAEGLRQDFSPTAHLFLRLRKWHPFLAVLLGAYVAIASGVVARKRPGPAVGRIAGALGTLFFVQLGAGILNLALLAPTWLQLVHLLLADSVWIGLVLLAGAALGVDPAAQGAEAPALAAE